MEQTQEMKDANNKCIVEKTLTMLRSLEALTDLPIDKCGVHPDVANTGTDVIAASIVLETCKMGCRMAGCPEDVIPSLVEHGVETFKLNFGAPLDEQPDDNN